ncbi:MAG: glycerol-3-phosphate 1-O-acyltransferase PlsY [Nitrospinota bacterium]
MPLYAAIVVAYLIGSIPAALIAGHAIGKIDIRTVGSKNAGATNIYRVFGIKPYLAVLAFDVAKGYFAASFVASFAATEVMDGLQLSIVCGLVAVIGHVFSVFARFRGGKGVATAAGVMVAIVPGPLLVAVLVYLGVLGATSYVSLGSIGAAVSLPVALLAGHFLGGSEYRMETYAITFLLALLILVTHRSNIDRLIKGKETKTHFFKKPKT